MGQSVNSMASIRVDTCTESKCLSQGLISAMKVEPLLGLFFEDVITYIAVMHYCLKSVINLIISFASGFYV